MAALNKVPLYDDISCNFPRLSYFLAVILEKNKMMWPFLNKGMHAKQGSMIIDYFRDDFRLRTRLFWRSTAMSTSNRMLFVFSSIECVSIPKLERPAAGSIPSDQVSFILTFSRSFVLEYVSKNLIMNKEMRFLIVPWYLVTCTAFGFTLLH